MNSLADSTKVFCRVSSSVAGARRSSSWSELRPDECNRSPRHACRLHTKLSSARRLRRCGHLPSERRHIAGDSQQSDLRTVRHFVRPEPFPAEAVQPGSTERVELPCTARRSDDHSGPEQSHHPQQGVTLRGLSGCRGQAPTRPRGGGQERGRRGRQLRWRYDAGPGARTPARRGLRPRGRGGDSDGDHDWHGTLPAGGCRGTLRDLDAGIASGSARRRPFRDGGGSPMADWRRS